MKKKERGTGKRASRGEKESLSCRKRGGGLGKKSSPKFAVKDD